MLCARLRVAFPQRTKYRTRIIRPRWNQGIVRPLNVNRIVRWMIPRIINRLYYMHVYTISRNLWPQVARSDITNSANFAEKWNIPIAILNHVIGKFVKHVRTRAFSLFCFWSMHREVVVFHYSQSEEHTLLISRGWIDYEAPRLLLTRNF